MSEVRAPKRRYGWVPEEQPQLVETPWKAAVSKFLTENPQAKIRDEVLGRMQTEQVALAKPMTSVRFAGYSPMVSESDTLTYTMRVTFMGIKVLA